MAPIAAFADAFPTHRPAPRGPTSPARLFLVPPAAEPASRAAALPESRLAALYRDFGPVVYRRCLRLLRNREEAHDATQEVFLRLVRNEARLFDREDLTPWLFRVATNHCLNLRRATHHHGETPLDDGEAQHASPVGDRVNAILVQQLLARFDVVTQAIATAVLVEDREHEEVAAALGLSRRTMARKLERFLEQARRHLVVSGDASAREGLV